MENTLDFSELSQFIEDLNFSLDADELFSLIVTGNFGQAFDQILNVLYQIFINEIADSVRILAELLLLAVLSGLMTSFTSLFKNSSVQTTAFYIIYIAFITLLCVEFSYGIKITYSYIDLLVSFIKILMPVYTITLFFTSSASTVGIYYDTIMALVSITELLISQYLLPVIRFYILLNFADSISAKDWLSKSVELIEGGIEWVIKSLFIVFVGIEAIQKMILPVLDSTTKGLIAKSVNAIPGLGQTASAVTSMMVGSGILIRNGTGVLGVIVITTIFLIPAVKLFVMLCMLRISSALMEPICDKRLIQAVSRTGNAVKMLMKIVLFSGMMQFVTIAMTCIGGNTI